MRITADTQGVMLTVDFRSPVTIPEKVHGSQHTRILSIRDKGHGQYLTIRMDEAEWYDLCTAIDRARMEEGKA